MKLSPQLFQDELAAAQQRYEKYIVCLEKTPDQFLASLKSLLKKAIKAFEDRGPGLRHGIALDRQVTIILSETKEDRPLCGIYFNLHSPYQSKS